MTQQPPRVLRVAVTALTAIAAIVALASSLTPTLPWRERLLAGFEPGPAQVVAHAAGVVGGLALLALTPGLLHGRRRAGTSAIAVLCVLAVVHTAKGLDYEEAAIALGAAAILRRVMVANERERGPSRTAVAVLAGLAALAGSFGVCLTALLVRSSAGRDDEVLLARAASALWSIVEGDRTAVVAGTAAGALRVLIGVAVLAAALAVRALLAPARPVDGHDRREHAGAAAIVEAYGEDSIAPFVLRADKAFFFARGGLLAYRTVGSMAVVSGDPIGPPGAAPAILLDFIEDSARRGWDVVVTAAAETHLAAYRAAGLRTMQIGLEGVARPGTLSLAGNRHKSLRKAVNRVERRGWTVEIRTGAELGDDLLAELTAVQRTWAVAQPRHYGFAMAMDRLWGAPEDARDLYVVGRDPGGAAHGFLRFVPYRRGLSLDAMRRIGDEPNGFTEALVVAALRHAEALGCEEVSLNFAGFAHVMAADAMLGRGARVLRRVLHLAHRRFQLERLSQFNQRFDPVWRPRHLVYTSATSLPLAALRVLQAEAYVRPPRARPRPHAWRPSELPARGTAAIRPNPTMPPVAAAAPHARHVIGAGETR
jgi:lysyl-tRNA synthetase, class II